MKKAIYVGVYCIVILGLIFNGVSMLKVKTTEAEVIIVPTSETAPVKDILTERQRAWLGALMWCESKAMPTAVNPNDSDNTPSYGILQFKPGSFTYFMKRYALGTSSNYMDHRLQQKIVEQMIIRADVKWSQQFPACTRSIGLPPVSTTLSTSSATTSIDKNR